MRLHWVGGAAAGLIALAVGGGCWAGPRLYERVEARRDGWALGIHLGERGGEAAPFVIRVDPQAPARLAGLRQGDEIFRIQDQPARGLKQVLRALGSIPAGQSVRLQVRRGAMPVAVEFASPGPQQSSSRPGKGRQAVPPAASPTAGDQPPAESASGDSAAGSPAPPGKPKKSSLKLRPLQR
jgi:hypothetical protein